MRKSYSLTACCVQVAASKAKPSNIVQTDLQVEWGTNEVGELDAINGLLYDGWLMSAPSGEVVAEILPITAPRGRH